MLPWAIDEATIIAVPDAVQRGWFQADRQELASPPRFVTFAAPRVVALPGLQTDAANSTRACAAAGTNFKICDLLIVKPPQLQGSEVRSGRYLLQWQSQGQPFASFTDFLEEAVDPDFVTANPIYQGNAQQRTHLRPASRRLLLPCTPTGRNHHKRLLERCGTRSGSRDRLDGKSCRCLSE